MHVGMGVKCIPTHLVTFDCRLDVEVEGQCPIEPDKDPLLRHDVQIVLKAPSKGSKPPYLQSWHFDRHIDSINPPNPAHPRYHFSFGGREMKVHLQQCGKTHADDILLLDTPRLAHAPFDGVLAIDFVLSNFAGKRWRTLCQLDEYRRIVTSSQQRLWQPYVLALYAHWWGDGTKKEWSAAEVWPHLQ